MLENLKRPPVVIVLIALLLAGLISWVFIASQKNRLGSDPFERYRVPENFSAADLQRMIDVMKQDEEFAFYFVVLNDDQQAHLRQQAVNIILANPSRDQMLAQVKSSYDTVRAIGSTFYYLDFPENYIQDPGRYLQLEQMFWTFLEEEFKLAVLGAFYKVHYDDSFMFQWDTTTALAGEKLRDLWGKHVEYYRKIESL